MKFKKKITLVLSLVFVMSALGGCQSKEKPADNVENQSNVSDTEENTDGVQSAEVEEIGYIYTFDIEEMSFDFDSIEWITLDNTDRIEELELDPEVGFENGFYIHNPEESLKKYTLSENTEYEIIDWSNGENGVPAKVDLTQFLEHLNSFTDYTPPFWIVTDGEATISISEQYTP